MVRIYTYKNCSTCRKATAWLRERAIAFEEMSIRETPPSTAELDRMLGLYGGDIRRLFNTSGRDYRELSLKTRLPNLSPDEAISLLRENGNLVKRPFLLTNGSGCVGFRENEWEVLFGTTK